MNREELGTENGPYKSNNLEKMYNRLMRKNLNDLSDDKEERWEVYDLIMFELKREHNYKTYDEIKYRITDGENPNEVFYDIILRGDYSSPLIWLFKSRIEGFLDEDTYGRFYK